MENKKPLQGQVALITGASRGIGLAIAETLAAMGAKVSICARKAEELERAAAGLRAKGADVFAMPADMTQTADIVRLAGETERKLGPVDILVNNAGVGRFGAFQEQSEQDWDAVLDTNLKGVFLLSKEIAPSMISRSAGHIINIASLAGKNAFAGGAIYCASKWGLLGLTNCMAEDLRAHGIRVSVICPGSVATDFSPPTKKNVEKMLQPVDVAHVVASLVTQAPQSFMSEILIRPTQKP
jgi:NAD(P)-dependent dehydrogenase (short-subunit alcohol dehydrogenase family)